jgi:23S rRNA (adenine2503-C2)-methyltransferase
MSSLTQTETAMPAAALIDAIEKAPLMTVTDPVTPGSSLVGLTRAQMADALRAINVPDREIRMRVAQIWHWIYHRGAHGFSQMLNVSKALRAELSEIFTLARPEVVSGQISKDGTRKWLMRMPATGPLDKGAEIEAVYIPEATRGTLCISSQVGCTLSCTFCHTGTQRLVRNLTAAEIVAQVVVARDLLGDWPGATRPGDGLIPDGLRAVSNIVLMGMGEPLFNFENVRDAMAVVMDGDGLTISKRRITLSTSGVVPMIERAGEEIGSMLAISLHAVRDELRNTLVPLNKRYPIKDLLDACRHYPGVSNSRRITFEYVMLNGINDSNADAHELVRLLRGIPAKINLIPFNPWPGTDYTCSDWGRIEEFSEIVFRAGYASPVRTPRGRDILAACGQLKSETEKLRARARLMLESGIGAEGLYAMGDDDGD